MLENLLWNSSRGHRIVVDGDYDLDPATGRDSLGNDCIELIIHHELVAVLVFTIRTVRGVVELPVASLQDEFFLDVLLVEHPPLKVRVPQQLQASLVKLLHGIPLQKRQAGLTCRAVRSS